MKPALAAAAPGFVPPPTRTLDCDAPVNACAFDRHGSIAAFALGDGRIRLLPLDRSLAPAPITASCFAGTALSLLADPAGDGFVAGGDDGRLLRLDAAGTASEIAAWKGKWIETLAAHPGSGALAVAVGRLAVVLARSGAQRELGPHDSTVADLDFSPDGSRLVAAHYNGVTLWSLKDSAAAPRRFVWKGSHLRVRWSPDNRFIATSTQENDLHVWRLAQATDMRMAGYPAKVKSMLWSHDARWLLTASQPLFTAWPFTGKGPEGKPPLQFGESGAGLMTVVAIHPRSEFFAAGFDSGEMQLGDLRQRRAVVLRLADTSPITCLAWSPDGKWLAAGNEAGSALLIDLRR